MGRNKNTNQGATKSRRVRRSIEEQIADLEDQLEELRDRRAAKAEFEPVEIAAERERLGLSAKHYADLVGVSSLTIYSWEHGKSEPRAAQLDKWLEVRGIGRDQAYSRLGLENLKEREKFAPESVLAERERLELSARDYGDLVGVSMLTIYNWEKGKSEPRQEQLERWLSVRGIGKREAWKRLGY
jgi:DNA-binding transcriptional regulator YiaG